jgi:hypothetical protein
VDPLDSSPVRLTDREHIDEVVTFGETFRFAIPVGLSGQENSVPDGRNSDAFEPDSNGKVGEESLGIITPSSAATTRRTSSIPMAPAIMVWTSRRCPGTSITLTSTPSHPLAHLPGGEAELDRDPPALFLRQPVGVDPRQGAHQRGLAVVDVTGRAQDEATHPRTLPRAVLEVGTEARGRLAPPPVFKIGAGPLRGLGQVRFLCASAIFEKEGDP